MIKRASEWEGREWRTCLQLAQATQPIYPVFSIWNCCRCLHLILLPHIISACLHFIILISFSHISRHFDQISCAYVRHETDSNLNKFKNFRSIIDFLSLPLLRSNKIVSAFDANWTFVVG